MCVCVCVCLCVEKSTRQAKFKSWIRLFANFAYTFHTNILGKDMNPFLLRLRMVSWVDCAF